MAEWQTQRIQNPPSLTDMWVRLPPSAIEKLGRAWYREGQEANQSAAALATRWHPDVTSLIDPATDVTRPWLETIADSRRLAGLPVAT